MRSERPRNDNMEVPRAGWPALSVGAASATDGLARTAWRFGCAAISLAAILVATPLAAQTPAADTTAADAPAAVAPAAQPPAAATLPPDTSPEPQVVDNQLANLYDKYQLDISLTTIILNATIRVDAEGVGGTELDAEDDLGLPKTRLQPRGSFRWRPGRKHELEAGYQFVRRDGDVTLGRTINIGENTYEAGLQLDTKLNTDQLFLTYRWAFVAKERTQVGLGVGLGILFIDIGVDGAAGIDSNEVEISTEKSLKAPEGSVGLYGRFLAGDRWQFNADARYIQVKIGRLDPARVFEGGGSARYYIKKWIGLEAGYSFSAFKLDIAPRTKKSGEEGIFSGLVEYSLQNARFGVVIVPNW